MKIFNFMKKYLSWVAAIGFTASLIAVVPAAFAQGNGLRFGRGMMPGSGAMGVVGTVTAVNGNTITVSSRMRMGMKPGSDGDGERNDDGHSTSTLGATTTVVYTIDATNALVYKNGATSTIGSVAVNDIVMAQGTVTGVNVVATVIRDGMGGNGMGMGGPWGNGHGGKDGGDATSTPRVPPVMSFEGNGQPVVGGKLTAINGSLLTVTTASNVIYAVDATNAKFLKNGTSTPLSAAIVGESVIVQGVVNGTNVVASVVIDQGSGASSSTPTRGPPAGVGIGMGNHFGFFGGIGNFFKHLFGF